MSGQNVDTFEESTDEKVESNEKKDGKIILEENIQTGKVFWIYYLSSVVCLVGN